MLNKTDRIARSGRRLPAETEQQQQQQQQFGEVTVSNNQQVANFARPRRRGRLTRNDILIVCGNIYTNSLSHPHIHTSTHNDPHNDGGQLSILEKAANIERRKKMRIYEPDMVRPCVPCVPTRRRRRLSFSHRRSAGPDSLFSFLHHYKHQLVGRGAAELLLT